MSNGFSARQYGIVGPHIRDVTVYVSERPGPRNEHAISVPITTEALDTLFESGGSKEVREFLQEKVFPQLFEKVIDYMVRDYETEERERNRPANRFGPLGAFLEIGRPDIIRNFALEEHEKRKASEREVRDERQDGV